MTTATETYAQLFDAVSQSNEVKQLVKAASMAEFFEHPATAYTLGALGMGIGLPVAYSLGQRSARKEIAATRNKALEEGIRAAILAAQNAQPPLGYLPEDAITDENAMSYYGLAPGVNDMYGSDNPDFGSYE